ncbi:MAG: HAD-IIIA family hydrolase, partial [Spirochaetaceae bacterium]|nr:HAD-IIIA family hydrolase [Spirochaetaceae bacterium]
MKVVIMAGGKGTRIALAAPGIPKPMISLCGKPILEHQIGCLAAQGLRDVTIVTGHLGSAITNYFGDGSRFGVRISYFQETAPLGTGGALFCLDGLGGDFLLINGDIIFDVDFERLIAFHRQKNALASLVSHPNNHPYDSGLLLVDRENRLTGWLTREEPRLYNHNLVNAGIHVISAGFLAQFSGFRGCKVDLDRELLKPSIPGGRIFAYKTPEYIKDVGTPERCRETGEDIRAGRVAARSLRRKQRAVFLDRDGTINQAAGFISLPEDLVLLDGAGEALRRINDEGYLAVVVTNQAVIARGECSPEMLDRIHQKMETELGRAGAFIDALYYCPHHPHKGFPGEVPSLKIDCQCRKPKPGMLLAAAGDYNIDLAASWMVGDDDRDMEAGRAAGCRTFRGTVVDFAASRLMKSLSST